MTGIGISLETLLNEKENMSDRSKRSASDNPFSYNLITELTKLVNSLATKRNRPLIQHSVDRVMELFQRHKFLPVGAIVNRIFDTADTTK